MWQIVTARKKREELLATSEYESGHGAGGLVRSLRTLDLLAIGIGSTVGTGVFSLTGYVARMQAGPGVILCWLIGGAGCLLSALGYIELSARLPVTGSVYAFAYHALGEGFAVIAAACITLEYGISASAVAANWGVKLSNFVSAAGAPKLASFMSINLLGLSISAPAVILLFIVTCLIYTGGVLGKVFARGSSTLAVVMILGMSVAALTQLDGSNFEPFIPPELGMSGVMAGSVSTFFGFLGYDEVCCLAGEAQDPRKSVPRAVFGTVTVATLLPVLGSIALVGLQPYTQIDKDSGFEVAFRDQGWIFLAHAVSLGELIVLFVVTYMCFLAQPRVFYALAKDGLLPAKFLEVNAQGVPCFATIVTGVLLTVCGALLPFGRLANAISGGVCVAFNLVNCCVIVLRLGGSHRPGSGLQVALAVFVFSSGLAALLCRNAGSITSAIGLLAIVSGLVALMVLALIARRWQEVDLSDNSEVFFRVPCVPWIPALAILFNNVMLTSLEMIDFIYLAVYLVAVIVPYLVFTVCRMRRLRAAAASEVSFATEALRC